MSTSTTGARNRRADAHCGPPPQRCPKRRPPLLKPPKTAIAAEVVYVLGRLPARAILTSTRLPHHLDNQIDGKTSPVSTQHLLPTPPRRPTLTRIGYEDMDRLLTYPDANNLSGSQQLTHKRITYPRKRKEQLPFEVTTRVPASQIRRCISSRSTTKCLHNNPHNSSTNCAKQRRLSTVCTRIEQ